MANNQNISQLMDIIRRQQEAIDRQSVALQAIQQERRNQTNQQQQTATAAENDRIAREARIRNVVAAGGIYGYESGRVLDADQREFKQLIIGFGVNPETADEVFRQGLDGITSLRRTTPERLKNIIYNISKKTHPDCPDPTKVFLGAAFEDKITVVLSWLTFQRLVGGAMTAKAWNDTVATSERDTIERDQYYKEIESSKGTEDITMPDPLTEMKKFRSFSEHLMTYLRTKRGAANVPIIYVLRDDKEVTDKERDGSVGPDDKDPYKNWDDFMIRCTIMEGTHWESDNSSLWQIINKLVRDGPGWDYIQKHEKVGNGDGRGAYLELKAQAYQYSNIKLITDEAHRIIEKLEYKGPEGKWTYDKYVRAWLRNIRVLKEHDDCPSERRLVSNFCKGITDPRLEVALHIVEQENSGYQSDFEKTQKYFHQALASKLSRDTRNVSKNRGVAAVSHDNSVTRVRQPYTGTLEAKDYSNTDWFSMTTEQKNQVRALRQKDAAKRQREVSAVSSNDKGDSEKKNAGDQFGRRAHSNDANPRKKKKT